MAQGVKQRMVEGAVVLLAKHGLQATSFSDVLALTGAPRGSVYHHFPEGKEQLVAVCASTSPASAPIALLDELEGECADEIVATVPRDVAQHPRAFAISVPDARCWPSPSPPTPRTLLEHAATVFRTWRGRLATLLESGGLESADATGFATVLVAASEGAVVLGRAEQSMEPFDLVAERLLVGAESRPARLD